LLAKSVGKHKAVRRKSLLSAEDESMDAATSRMFTLPFAGFPHAREEINRTMPHVNPNLLPTLFLSCLLLTTASAQRTPASLPTAAPQARKSYVAVLVWHDVLPKKEVWFDTTLATFRQQLETIRRRKFTILTLDALRQHLTQGTPIPPRSLVLTFDDNTRGLY